MKMPPTQLAPTSTPTIRSNGPWKLDVLVPSFNRPAKLHHLLDTGLTLGIPGASFVVLDDGSSLVEDVPGLGQATTEDVCKSFKDGRVVYIRNETNIGLAATLARYYAHICEAEYAMLVNDKDEFINSAPILRSLRKLDTDKTLSMVMIALRQVDRETADRPLPFNYPRMSGREFLARYAQDTMLQHSGMYGIIRVAAIRRAGVPRPLNLRQFGLEDAFGIDVDFLLMIATTGDFEFESEPHVRRSVVGGLTERYPLTFAYSYYQYAKRAMQELSAAGFVDRRTLRHYIGWWLLLIGRGLVVAYQPLHGTEQEPGTNRIRGHLPTHILLYLPIECLRFRILPTREMADTYARAAKRMLWSAPVAALLKPISKRYGDGYKRTKPH